MKQGRPSSIDYQAVRNYLRERLQEIAKLEYEIDVLLEKKAEARAKSYIKNIAQVFGISTTHAERIINNREI